MSKRKISVVTSAYNEEAGIRACYEEVRRVMGTLADRYDYEHVVADNCSTDRTAAILEELAAGDPHLKVLLNARNFGAEKSAFNALRYATGDAVVGITADMQEPPSLIPDMVRLWENGNEVVYGQYRNVHEGFVMRGVRKLYYWLVDKLSTETLPREFTGFALMDRRVVDEVVSIEDFAPYIRGIIATVGFRQVALPFDRAPRVSGRSKHGLAFLFDFAINGIISHSLVPIRAATLTGLLLFCLSLLITATVLTLRLVAPQLQAPGATTIVTIVTFFSGVQLLFLGLLGEYIGAIHGQVRRKPFVVVRRAINFDDDVRPSSKALTRSVMRARRRPARRPGPPSADG